jgi:hypothetical protein
MPEPYCKKMKKKKQLIYNIILHTQEKNRMEINNKTIYIFFF